MGWNGVCEFHRMGGRGEQEVDGGGEQEGRRGGAERGGAEMA